MVAGGLQRSLALSRQTARLTRRTVKHHRRGHGTWPRRYEWIGAVAITGRAVSSIGL